jgi:hypothetical protein
VYILIAHTIHISLYFFITLFKFYKMCARRCAQIMTFFFFFFVDINLNHNVILYFFITCIVNFVLVVNVFLALY